MKNENIARIANYISAVIVLSMGIIYLFKGSFMPYHSEAVSVPWEEVSKPFQYLILALMRVVGGGYIGAAIVIVILQRNFAVTNKSWVCSLILIHGLIVSITSLYATLIIRFNSPGEPPTTLAIVLSVLIIIGCVFNHKAIKDS